MDAPRVIFQHTPKCGGVSVRRALVEVYGVRELYSDTLDRIVDPESLFNRDRERYFADARSIRPTQAFICGHFPIRKYAHIGDALRVTIIRHPIARTISHYLWLKATRNDGNYLWRFVRDGTLDLAGFAALPEVSGFYRHYFFADCTAADYDVVIVQEQFARGLGRLSRLVGSRLRLHHENVTSDVVGTAAREAARLSQDRRVRAELAHELADDIAWFDEVRRWRAAVWTD